MSETSVRRRICFFFEVLRIGCPKSFPYREEMLGVVAADDLIDLVSWPEVHAGAMRWMRLKKQVIATQVYLH